MTTIQFQVKITGNPDFSPTLEQRAKGLIEKLDPCNACTRYELFPEYEADPSKMIIFAKRRLEPHEKPSFYKRISEDNCYEVLVEKIDTDKAREFLVNCTNRAIPAFINMEGKSLYIHPGKVIDPDQECGEVLCPDHTNVQSMVPDDPSSRRMFRVLEATQEDRDHT